MTAFVQSIRETPVAVLGAGSWGTALAILLANNQQPVRLWSHDKAHLQEMRHTRVNARYLPQIALPDSILLCEKLTEALFDVQDVLIVVPSYAFAELMTHLKPFLLPETRLVWGTKGLTAAQELLHTAAKNILKHPHSLAALSGPSFAKEVAAGLPTAVTVATSDELFAQSLIARFNNSSFRVYTTADITGVEVCGVVKNVLAIGAGIIDGLNLGANALSAFITRGLVEMQRLTVALGGQAETCTGLAGLGDLVLSCTDNQSRNRRFGRAIAQGKTADQARAEIGQAVEGYANVKATYELTQKLAIEMPITEQVYQVIYQNKVPQLAIQALLSREPKQE